MLVKPLVALNCEINRQETSSEQIKGMDLTETILNYKPERPKKSVYQKSENEDPLRSGLGYEGYMDCLLRGRRHRLTRKQWVSLTQRDIVYFSLSCIVESIFNLT